MATGGYSDYEQGQDETFDFLCSVCQLTNKNTEAEKFCTQCRDYFCSSCVKIHERVSGMRQHKILDKFQFNPRASFVFPTVITETCKHHGHKPVDMYCEMHDQVGCTTCIVIDHSECLKKFYIPDYIQNKQAGNPADLSAHLDTLQHNIQELLKAFNDDDRKLRTSKDDLINQIKQLRMEINQKLEELEKNTIERADTAFQSVMDNVQCKIKKFEHLLAEINSTQDSLKATAANQAQLYVSMKKASDVVSRATEAVLILTTTVSPTVSFSADQTLQPLREIEILGSIYFTEATDDQDKTKSKLLDSAANEQPGNAAEETLESQTKTNQQMPPLLKIKQKKKYLVKLSSDNHMCSIWSACVLDDGTVILADRKNSNIKVLHRSSYKVTECCDVSSWPWQVCAISQQEVAVTCPESKLIQFVSTGHEMFTTSQIHTDFCCHGLACADGKLYVSDAITVYVYTVSGERLRQFSKDQSGQSLFSLIRSLAVSSDKSRIYIADSNKGLIILDTSGQLVGHYSDTQLSGARNVCLYKNDSVLVCGLYSKNVLQFTAAGQLTQELLKTDESCQVVCWNERNSNLMVISHSQNKIDVYNVRQKAYI